MEKKKTGRRRERTDGGVRQKQNQLRIVLNGGVEKGRERRRAVRET
jgi:molybdenum cofactor biosynthesis enzyme